ncbi:MAG TPA: hypothetical protein VGX28_11605 [Frankiaceae bacterium]|jgi:hypothetical protein|nr:hypothetical protein [Frankiaceae bacterium]
MPRAVTVAVLTPVLAAGLAAAAPAASATNLPPSCSAAVPLVDFDVLGSPTTIATQAVSPTQTNVCLRSMDLFDLVLVVNGTVTLGEPEVQPGTGQFPCEMPIFESRQPVPFSITYGVGGPTGTLCVEINGTATTLDVVGLPIVAGVPTFELWTNGDTALDRFVLCGTQYLDYLQDTSLAYQWMSCYQSTRRVL